MNKKHFKYLMVFGFVLIFSSTAFAQGQSDAVAGMLRTELERTDELIIRAREAVRVSNSVRAEVYLENAVSLQTEAWDQFRMGTTAGFKNAGVWTKQAREQAKGALAAARYTQQNQDVVQRKLERANELLERTRENLQTQQATQVMQSLYDMAEDNLRNAWEFYRNGEYRPALKLSNQVENAIRRIVVAGNKLTQESTSYERYADNVKDMLEGTRNQIADCNSETALKLLEEAQISYDRAHELKGEEKSGMAMEALKTSKKLATRARLECSGFDGSLSERYDRLAAEAHRVSDLLTAQDNEASQLVDQAYEQLDLAAEYIANGQTQEAAASLKAAQLALDQALRLLEADSTE